jgi:rhodanese-related sulfurtransferase
MPRSLPPIQSPAPALPPSAAAHSLDPLEVAQRLARPELAAASQSDPSTLLVVDVRSRRQFARGHLPLSQPIPAGLLVSGEWPDGDLLLVDDGTGEAERVREALHRGGYPRRILQLAGGFEAWRAAGFPVEGSRPSWFLPRWLGLSGPTTPALADLQALLGNSDLEELLGSDERLPDLARLRRA